MSSNVTCRATEAAWAVDALGQDVCHQYAEILGICDPSFLLSALTPASPPYLPPSAKTAACACNLVAYNLASACRWCQDTLQPLWWATQAEWTARCTSLGQPFFGRGLPSTLVAANLTISDWALNVMTTNGTWDPTLVPTGLTTPEPSGIAEGGPSTPLSSVIPEFPPSWGRLSDKEVIGITLGTILLTLFLGWVMGFILCRRWRARREEQARAQRECESHDGAENLPEQEMDAKSISSMPPRVKRHRFSLIQQYLPAFS